MTAARTFAWCTYRDWSFQVLEGLLDCEGWRCALIITTHDCRYDFARLERAGLKIMRIDPKKDLNAGQPGFEAIKALSCEVVFHYGWSWIVPEALCQLCLHVTLHPGKLPRDRGGSPLQNQIRNGEEWSWANIIELVKGLDEGRIYGRARFSLAGDDVDGVWARMIASGSMVTRKFLGDLAAGRANAVAQDSSVSPTIYKRVQPAAAQLLPDRQTARLMYDIVRAHNETDANTYVQPAYLALGTRELVVLRASLIPPAGVEIIPRPDINWNGEAGFEICHRVNNGDCAIAVRAIDDNSIYLTRCRLRCVGIEQGLKAS